MKLAPAKVDEILAALYDRHAAALTKWESEFVASIQAQWRRRHHLSPGQLKRLAEVWGDVTSGRRAVGS